MIASQSPARARRHAIVYHNTYGSDEEQGAWRWSSALCGGAQHHVAVDAHDGYPLPALQLLLHIYALVG